MNELALFAGAGGGILGGNLLGWRTVCAVERDANCAQILAQRQNDRILKPFPIWSDVQSFDPGPWDGIVDIISAGFPCQDISPAGKGAGLQGERSGLFWEIIRIARGIPRAALWLENSSMLTTRGLHSVLGALAEMGFDAEWGCLSAAAIGADHKRERIWILAYPKRVQEREKSRSGEAGRVGRIIKPISWDEPWESALSRLRGASDGVACAMDRTDSIRNGQVPAVAATAFTLLRERAGW